MAIKEKVKAALKTFEKENPKLKNKAYCTSGSRSWENQLDIIINPKRKKNYLPIKKRFLKKFSTLKNLPETRKGMTKEQLEWWKAEIMKQAGKSPGFPHVGGKAQDVSVKKLTLEGKKALKKILEDAKLKILLEYVTGDDSDYGVKINKANVFHIYK